MHFLAGVITRREDEDEVYKILEPYQEYDGTEETKRFAIFEDCDEDNQWLYEEKYKEKYASYEEFLKSDDADGELHNGKRGYWNNPNSQWDWYKIGGRWDGLLNPESQTPNQIKISDLNFVIDAKIAHTAKRGWEIVVEGQEKTEEDEDYYISKEFLLDHYESKEEYMRIASSSLPYCFFTPDGEFVEKDYKEKFNVFEQKFYDVLEKYKDCYLFYVDLHI